MFELAPFDLPADYGEGIVPLVDIKDWCSVEASDDRWDDLLAAARDTGVDMVERYCGVYLAVREGVVWTAEALPERFRLPLRPITEITAFDYLDSDGALQSLSASLLRLSAGGEIRLVAGETWPTIGGGIELKFTAGFTDANRPSVLVTAVKMFAAHLFANREAVSTSGSVAGEVPLGFQRLCALHRPVLI